MSNEQLGLIQDPLDPRDIWLDELNLSGTAEFPEEFLIPGLQYEYQGPSGYCVSFATTTLLEYKYQQLNKSAQQPRYSPEHLFYHAGGTKNGSNFRSNLLISKNNGCIPYERMPLPNPISWNTSWISARKKDAESIPFTDVSKTDNFAHVTPTVDRIKSAILDHGPLLVGVYAIGDYYTDPEAKRPPGAVDNHAVLIVGWTKDHFVIFDSLKYVERGGPGSTTPGYRLVSIDYGFDTAYAILELPEDWREQRDTYRSEGYENCLNHYGKPRDFLAEQRVAGEMAKEFEKFNNRSVLEAAGRFWTIYINAIVYGGYNLSYRKLGRWMPGDVINDCYNWRRTGAHIFDFNEPHDNQI